MTTVSVTRRTTTATSMGLALCVLLAACSGSSSSTTTAAASASEPSAVSSDAAAASSVAPAPSSAAADDSGGNGGGGDSGEFCDLVKKQTSILSGADLTALITGGSEAAWKAYLAKASAANQELVNAAPPQIRSSVVTAQETTKALQGALEAANYDITKLGTAGTLAILNNPTRIAASRTLATYVQDTCKIDLTKAFDS